MKKALRWLSGLLCKDDQQARKVGEERRADTIDSLNFASEYGDSQDVQRIIRLSSGR